MEKLIKEIEKRDVAVSTIIMIIMAFINVNVWLIIAIPIMLKFIIITMQLINIIKAVNHEYNQGETY